MSIDVMSVLELCGRSSHALEQRRIYLARFELNEQETAVAEYLGSEVERSGVHTLRHHFDHRLQDHRKATAQRARAKHRTSMNTALAEDFNQEIGAPVQNLCVILEL